MQTDQLTDNEVIADFIGKRLTRELPGDKQQWQLPDVYGYYPSADSLEFDKRWDRLMPVWYKFATTQIESLELNFPFAERKDRISHAILYEGIGEACKLLAEGIRWYNSINQTVKK